MDPMDIGFLMSMFFNLVKQKETVLLSEKDVQCFLLVLFIQEKNGSLKILVNQSLVISFIGLI
jgi:hypothetical protein